jgi:prepilin-type N-terminal cleavage/methylation domain-containing protein
MRRSRTIHPFRRRAHSGFVLLEVIVSLVIMGISVATLMRSFTVSMNAIRKNDVTTQACVLAESVLQDMEVNPPASKLTRGTFEEIGYPKYSWTIEMKDEEIRYRNLKTKSRVDDLKPLHYVHLTITYDDGQIHRFNPIDVEMYLMPIERYAFRSKFLNELFLEDAQK